MAQWELLADEAWSKSIVRKPTYPDGSGYGTVYKYDLVPPQQILTFKGRGLTDSEVDVYRDAIKTRGVALNLTDSVGREWTGKVISLAVPVIQGTVYEEVTLQMEVDE